MINADSQQVYAAWQVVSARPTAAETARAPHRLYGHVGLREIYSTGRWLREATAELAAAGRAGMRPIFVGGTGLYFKSLISGIAPIPPTPAELRRRGELRLARLGRAAFAEALAARDPETLADLDRDNPMRLLRAWEVLELTGEGLAAWRRRTGPPALPLSETLPIVLSPPKPWLDARINARFDGMMAAGALEEVARAMAEDVPPDAPGLKAVGAPELAAHLRGERPLAAAVADAKTATRRYAKRQLTWARNQMGAWRRIFEPITPERLASLVRELSR